MNGLQIIENKNQRVLLTSQLAEKYETSEKRISENFNANKKRYEEGKHYFALEGQEKRDFLNHTEITDGSKNAKTIYLWTEKGALLHAKSLNTDRAWEVYGELVETYFRAQQRLPVDLSPQLQVMINLEIRQKQQAKALEDTNKRIDSIGELISLNPNSWRVDCKMIICKIARSMGGNEYAKEVNSEIYKLVDARAGCSLETRLTNKRRRMADEGVCKSRRDRANKLDVIADDKKLIEIYVAIVKEMAIKYGVAEKAS